ncbi:MAG TPA: hypothetical protein VFX12_05765 [Vicinamibacterales bacterium]|nr:hypothetical protein [Vicinamibacterales bacterium]
MEVLLDGFDRSRHRTDFRAREDAPVISTRPTPPSTAPTISVPAQPGQPKNSLIPSAMAAQMKSPPNQSATAAMPNEVAAATA